jgi:hypothetical protein
MNAIENLEVSNIYRTNVARRRLYKKNKRAKHSLEQQANAVCKDQLSERYIHNAFRKFDDGYMYYDRDESTLLGFSLWQKKVYKNIPTIHILLLCSQNPSYSLGITMVHDIEYYCFENKIQLLTVEPATEDLFEYYSKRGFQIDEETPNQMRKVLHMPSIQRHRANRTRKLPKTKSYTPMIASMMPIDMNLWKHNLV